MLNNIGRESPDSRPISFTVHTLSALSEIVFPEYSHLMCQRGCYIN